MDLIHVPTGKTIFKIDDGAGQCLLLLAPEAFVRTPPKPVHNVQQMAPAGPRWIVRKHPLTNAPELVRYALNQEDRYPGPGMYATAEGAKAAFAAAGHPVPEDVLQKFSALLEIAKGNDPDVVNDARERAQNQQYLREQKERAAQQKLQG